MDNQDPNEFMKQFGGSATANLVFCIAFFLYKFLESRCKHSKCSSNLSWCKCSADNYNTERGSSLPNIKIDGIRSPRSVQKLSTRNDQEIQERHSEIIQVKEPQGREHSRDFSMVKGGDNL